MNDTISKALQLVQNNERKIVVAFMLLVMVVGTAYSSSLSNTLQYPDERDYYTLARNIVEQRAFTLDGQRSTAFRPPGYPLMLAALHLVGAPIVALRVANFALLAISLYLVSLIAKSQATALAGTLGALLGLMYPVLLYTAGTLYPQTLASTLFLAILFLLTKKNSRATYALGPLFGWLILTIPLFITTVATLLIWLAWTRWLSTTRIVVALAVTLLIVGTWSLRNYAVSGNFTLVSTNSGINLLLGNSENTTANAGVNVDISRHSAVAERLGEWEEDRYFTEQAIAFIMNNKVHSMRMYGLKLLNYFNYSNQLYVATEASRARDVLMLLTYGALGLPVLVRLGLFKRFPLSQFEMLLLLLYLSSALFGAVFFTRIRFRLPYDFLLMIIVATFVDQLLRSSRPGTPSPPASRA